jgi:hypothetical protein
VFYKSTNGGADFFATGATSANVDGNPNLFQLQSMPGQAGTYFYTAGGQSGGAHPLNTRLWKSTDTCTTWSRVSADLKEVMNFGFGAPKPGSTFYTIYAYGWYKGVLGFYQSTDGGSTWSAIKAPASQLQYALNSADLVQYLSGDSNVYGRIYVAFRGSGAAYIDTQDACPAVAFSTVVANASLTGTVTLTAQHSGLVPVTSVQFKVDGTNIGSAQTGQTSYSVSWNTGSVGAGAHTLSVVTTGNECTGTGSTFSIPINTF